MWAAPSRSVLLSSSAFSPVLFYNIHSLSLEGPAANARDVLVRQSPTSVCNCDTSLECITGKYSKTGCCDGYGAFPDQGESASCNFMMLFNTRNRLGWVIR